MVKEDIKYTFSPHWGTPEQTLQERRGHCGMKSEVLVTMLRDRGFKARYVEGRQTGLRSTWILRILSALGTVIFDTHIWVEVFVDNAWLTLDSSPDSGIAHCLGDTKPGTHLGNPKQVTRWEEIPPWYRDFYNAKIYSPLRFAAAIEIASRRLTGRWHRTKKRRRILDGTRIAKGK